MYWPLLAKRSPHHPFFSQRYPAASPAPQNRAASAPSTTPHSGPDPIPPPACLSRLSLSKSSPRSRPRRTPLAPPLLLRAPSMSRSPQPSLPSRQIPAASPLPPSAFPSTSHPAHTA